MQAQKNLACTEELLTGSMGLGLMPMISLSTVTGAQTSLAFIDNAISRTARRRGGLGVAQNKLQVTINNLAAMHQNLSAANSRIRDADVALETANFARAQILMQAGVSVLAQPNQMPSLALSLIG